jgi:hypothetical protein
MNASLKTDDDDEDEAADRVRSDRKELLELCLRTTASISLCRCDRMDVQFSRVDCEDAIKITSTLNLMIIILLRAYSSHCGVEGVEAQTALSRSP